MSRYRVSTSFINFSIPQKIIHFRYVLIHMESNLCLNASTAFLHELAESVNELELLANTYALYKGRRTIKRLKLAEQKTSELFLKQAQYVDSISNGDMSVILKSGFHIEQVVI